YLVFFFSSRRRHTRSKRDWSSDVCSSDLQVTAAEANLRVARAEHERYKTLMGRQLVSRSQFDASENAFRSAQARLQQARAEFDEIGRASCRERGQRTAGGAGWIYRRE